MGGGRWFSGKRKCAHEVKQAEGDWTTETSRSAPGKKAGLKQNFLHLVQQHKRVWGLKKKDSPKTSMQHGGGGGNTSKSTVKFKKKKTNQVTLWGPAWYPNGGWTQGLGDN